MGTLGVGETFVGICEAIVWICEALAGIGQAPAWPFFNVPEASSFGQETPAKQDASVTIKKHLDGNSEKKKSNYSAIIRTLMTQI